jgi:hypothetical protein
MRNEIQAASRRRRFVAASDIARRNCFALERAGRIGTLARYAAGTSTAQQKKMPENRTNLLQDANLF